MISSVSMFTSITVVVSSRVKLSNGNYAIMTHIGTVQISEHLTLHDVLCVPSSFNLISASKLIKTLNCCLILLANFCFIQSLLPRRTIGVGREQSGLFYLLHKPDLHSTSAKAFSVSIKNVSNDIWHYRLGHLSHFRMMMLHHILPHFSCNSNTLCTLCPLTRQH